MQHYLRWKTPSVKQIYLGKGIARIKPLGLFRTEHHCPSTSYPAGGSSEAVQPDGILEPDGSFSKPLLVDQNERIKLWKRAIKAPMYSVGIMPILVSGMASFMQTGMCDPVRTALLCCAAICIIAWLNLTNDVFDSFTGVDKNKHESVVNLTGNRTAVFLIASGLLVAGGGLLFWLLRSVESFVAKMLYASICMGYLYQGPPFRWSYLGLGEPLCFLAFGPLATIAFYLAQLPNGAASVAAINPTIIGISILVGITTTVILFCSHFHQIDGDRLAGKNSPLVQLGLTQGAIALKVAVGFAYMLTLILSLLGILPFGCWTSAMVSYPIAGEMVKRAEDGASKNDIESLATLKMVATKWHIAFQCSIILGFIIQKLMVI